MQAVEEQVENVELWTYRDMAETLEEGGIPFVVPKAWAENQVREIFNMSLDAFLSWYTWDHTQDIYVKAKTEGVIIQAAGE